MKHTLATPAFGGTALTLAGAIGLHANWTPWWFTAALLGLIALRLAQRQLSPGRVHVLVRLALMGGMLIAIWINFAPTGDRPVYAAMLAAMLALKLLETDTVRDARLVVTFSCFLSMAGFLFEQGPVQSLLTAGVVVLAFATMHALVPGSARLAGVVQLRRALGAALRLCALAIPFAAIAFVAFPRLDTPLWGGPEDLRRGRTGMSDRLEPGQLSSLALDDDPAFRVTFDDALPAARDRYFRGLVFWWFDGEGWGGDGMLAGFNQAPDIRALQAPVEYEVMTQPTDQRWLFLLDAPVAAPRDGVLTGDLQGRSARPITSVTRYRGRSAVHYVMQAELPRMQRALGLRLPAAGAPRARALAQSWRRQYGSDDRAVIGAALGLFNREFIYSLDPPLAARDPVDDFLFDTRIGFCEHFASAFTVLMRAAGIPARVIVGYQGGYFNTAGGYLTVLNSDAHAWSEVWLDGEGWVRVDPTAAVAPERIERGSQVLRGAAGWLAGDWGIAVRDRWDVVGAWWNRTIVEFNALRQRSLFEGLGLPDASWRELGIVLLVGGLATLALAIAVGFRPHRAPRDAVLAAWRRFCVRLAGAGVARRPNEGPVDFAERAAHALPAHAEQIRALSSRFVSLRYARGADEEGAVLAFRRAISAFRPERNATTRRVRTSYAKVTRR